MLSEEISALFFSRVIAGEKLPAGKRQRPMTLTLDTAPLAGAALKFAFMGPLSVSVSPL
jgi:hypothetical protein